MVDIIKPELLCPVGGKEQLIAAVENGADAVYLGGAEFNARIYADNFDSIESIEQAVDYAHLRNVKVYVALNTLVNDTEFTRAIEYAKKLYEIGVDSIIVQDIGLVDTISKELPDFKVHMSTQATICSSEGVKYFNKYDSVERIVLARELSLKEIEEIVKSTDKEIEIFVHGALCVCYSGQCKLSSQIGARSGNRGKCAQPCRLPYKLKGDNLALNENYYLSTKDVCTIDILPKVISKGVHSLKIEGRMKSPEYVAAVTKIYRKYIDKCFEAEEYVVDKEDKDILLQVFNRGNFSEGYLNSKDSSKIWCNTKPKHLGTYLGKVILYDARKKNIQIKLEQDVSIGDVIEVSNKELSSAMISFIRSKMERVKTAKKGDIVTIGDIKGNISKGNEVYKITSRLLNEDLKKCFSGKSIKKTDLDIKVTLNENEVPEVKLNTKILGREFSVSVKEGNKCEKGINKVLTKEDVKSRFLKTGDVPFKVNNIEINLQDGIMMSTSNLNNVRRKAIEVLCENIVKSFKRDKVNLKNITDKKYISISNSNKDTKLSLYIYRIENLSDLSILNNVDRVYISLDDMVKNKDKILNNVDKEKICIYLPTITTKKYKEYINENLDIIKEIKNILVTNVEHLEIFKDINVNIYLDNSFNVFNSRALKAITENNIKGINLSNELTLSQINEIKVSSNEEIEIDIYGSAEVMYSKFCILNATKNCQKCKNSKYSLIDRKEKQFPVLFNNNQCTMQILNSSKLFSEEAIKSLNKKVDYMRLYIYDEDNKEIQRVIECINEILNKNNTSSKIVSDDNVKYTNGHFFREV